ncbi:hypothetical protein PAGU1678_29770 [Paraclostridium bifermentans subsp. muricolitidis]|nr:hypothetical protein PAGU1678_29770 [Paraclostridium bifermentans subsp. muricolitidis]
MSANSRRIANMSNRNCFSNNVIYNKKIRVIMYKIIKATKEIVDKKTISFSMCKMKG